MTAIFLFSIAGACASDANTTALDSVEEPATVTATDEIESDDSQILEAPESNEMLGDSITVTNHTFEAIQSAIDGANNAIYLEPGTYAGDRLINIYEKNDISIIGNSTVLDAQGQTGILAL